MATKSLTTVEQFQMLIAHLPIRLVGVNKFGGALYLPTEEKPDMEQLYHALFINANKRGLKARRGIAVMTVNGFAK